MVLQNGYTVLSGASPGVIICVDGNGQMWRGVLTPAGNPSFFDTCTWAKIQQVVTT